MKRTTFSWIALLLAGCTGLSGPAPVNQTLYVLDATPTVSATTAKRNLVLTVNTLPTRAGYDTSQMAYTQRAHELDYFAANRWVSPPARMIEPLIVTALEQTAAFRAVTLASNSPVGDLRLDVELIQLQQDFTVRPSRIELSVRAQLVELRSNRVLAARQFDEAEEATNEDARSGVAAANRALQRLLGKLVEYCLAESAGR